MTEANPTAGGKRAAGQVDDAPRRCRPVIAVAHPNEVAFRKRRGRVDADRAHASLISAVVAAHVELIAVGMREDAAVGEGQGSCAGFTNIDPARVGIDARPGSIHQDVPLRPRIDAGPDPPVVNHLASGSDVERAGAATLPGEQQIAAVGLEMLEGAAVGDIDRSHPAHVAVVIPPDGRPAIHVKSSAGDVKCAEASVPGEV